MVPKLNNAPTNKKTDIGVSRHGNIWTYIYCVSLVCHHFTYNIESDLLYCVALVVLKSKMKETVAFVH